MYNVWHNLQLVQGGRNLVEVEDWATRDTTKKQGWTQVLRKYRQFMLHLWHPSFFSCYKPSDKSSMRKRTGLWLWQTEHIHDHLWEEFEDTKGVIRICQSKKNRQYNEQKIKEKQRSTKHSHTTKDQVLPTPLQTEVNSERISSSFSTIGTCHGNLVTNPVMRKGQGSLT